MKKNVVVLVSLLLISSSALAMNKSGSLTVSPMFGNYLFDEDSRMLDEPIYSIGFGYNFSHHWGTELTGAFINKAMARNSSRYNDYVIAQLNGLYHLNPKDQVVFYVAMGVGYQYVNPSHAHTYELPYVNVGGGVKVRANDWLSLRLDVRKIYADDDDSLFAAQHKHSAFSFGPVIDFGGDSLVVKDVDSDDDGVIDSLDSCPNSATGASVDSLGCEIVDVSVVAAPDPTHSTMKKKEVVEPISDDARFIEEIVVAEQVETQKLAVTKGLVRKVNISFASGSDYVSPRYYDELKSVTDFINKDKTKKVVVEGHADSRGDAGANLRLSKKRAEKIREYLIDFFGVDAKRISSVGFGEEKPVESNATAYGRSVNRRVVIVVQDN